MKATIRHLAWLSFVLCCSANGQTASGTYTVKPGDNLSKIARSQGCTVAELVKANGMKLDAVIQPGQTLKLPGKTKVSPSSTAPTTTTATGGIHTIESGETFYSISRKYGVPVDTLLAANPDVNPKSVRPGQKIRLSAPSQPVAPKSEKTKEPNPVPPPSTPAHPAPAAETKTPKKQTAETPKETPHGESPANKSSEGTEEKVRTIVVETETTLGEFAAKHGTDVQRLNKLNGLDLPAATVLAKGSELYVPAQP